MSPRTVPIDDLDALASPLRAAPLYRQLAERLADRVYDGVWASGEAMPTELALAEEFGVSQGTVRKALTSLAAAGLVVRQQGRGTFVSDLGAERSWYHFFRLSRPNGERVTPEPGTERVRRRAPTRTERERFDDAALDGVHEIRRVRLADGIPAMRETVVVPDTLFAGLEARPMPLPAALYPFYHQAFGVFVRDVEEQVAAVAASAAVARDLDRPPGTPLLEIERVARDPRRRVVELRTSHYRSDRLRYRIELA